MMIELVQYNAFRALSTYWDFLISLLTFITGDLEMEIESPAGPLPIDLDDLTLVQLIFNYKPPLRPIRNCIRITFYESGGQDDLNSPIVFWVQGKAC